MADRSPRPADDARQAAAASLTTRLEEERRRTQQRVSALRRELADIVASAEGANTDDEHDPEGATIGFERAQVAALLDDARQRLTELDAAEDRLAAGTLERCEGCGRSIPTERLLARPTARRCVDCARERPRGG